VAAAAFALVFGALAIFGTDDDTSVAIVPAVDIGTTGNGSTSTTAAAPRVAGITATAPPAADTEAAAPGAPTTAAVPNAAGGSTDPAAAATPPAAGGSAPAPEPAGPSGPPPTSPVYPTVHVDRGGAGITVSMTGFPAGATLNIDCYRLPYDGEDTGGKSWIHLSYASATAGGDGSANSTCSIGGASGTHVFAAVNGSEAYSNHLEV
ncbi:MAG: hypothetical protein ABW033_08615, partial [Acidimicrobiia bacterium]